MKYKKGTFTVVPNNEYLEGKPPELLAVYFWLCKHADEDGVCFPSRPRLQKLTGIKSLRTIDKYIKKLVEDEILTKTVRKDDTSETNKSNLYQLHMVQPLQEREQSLLPEGATVDTREGATNDTITIPSINSTHLTQVAEPTAQPVLHSGQLPLQRGKTYIMRVLSIYCDLFRSKYGFEPTISIPRFGKALKTLMETKTELQISALMITFFNYAGMDGRDFHAEQKIIESAHNPFWFFSTVNTYETYLRNVNKLEFDNEDAVKKFVATWMQDLKNK